MRIATIRRNTSVLEKTLKSVGSTKKGMLEDEVCELVSRLKKCSKMHQEILHLNVNVFNSGRFSNRECETGETNPGRNFDPKVFFV
jgi:hypothetical protein